MNYHWLYTHTKGVYYKVLRLIRQSYFDFLWYCIVCRLILYRLHGTNWWFEFGLQKWSLWLTTRIQMRKEGATVLPLDKMAAIWADDNFRSIFLNKNDRISIRISLKFVPRSQIDNKTTLVQVMAWRRTGDKPLPEPNLTQFTDAYVRHHGEMS